MTTKCKTFVQFLKEELETQNILDLTVKYDVVPKQIILKAPSNYSEDQIVQYLQDLWFGELPGGPENLDKIFGVNGEHLIDTYLEYDGFTHSKDEIKGDEFIDWDSKEDPDNEQELEYFTIKNIKYCMSFDSFELKVEPGTKLHPIVEKIFESYESNAMNKYPIEIKLDKRSIEFKEDNM